MTGCDKWLTLFLFLLFGSMVAIAFQYPPEARFAPLVIGLPGIALCLVQLAFDLGYRRDALASAAPKLGRPANFVEDPTEFTPGTLHREFAAWGYFLGFVAALLALGFHVAVPALLFVYLWRETRLGWMFALSIGVGSLLVIIFIVSGALHLPLFAGFVVPALLRLPGG